MIIRSEHTKNIEPKAKHFRKTWKPVSFALDFMESFVVVLY